MTDIPKARPASTVVLLRDTDNGMETLMLKRNKALMFAGGLWVFPGGALEESDLESAEGDIALAARIAAAREAERGRLHGGGWSCLNSVRLFVFFFDTRSVFFLLCGHSILGEKCCPSATATWAEHGAGGGGPDVQGRVGGVLAEPDACAAE